MTTNLSRTIEGKESNWHRVLQDKDERIAIDERTAKESNE